MKITVSLRKLIFLLKIKEKMLLSQTFRKNVSKGALKMSTISQKSIGYIRERYGKNGQFCCFQICAYIGRENGRCKYRYGRADTREEAEALLKKMAAEIELNIGNKKNGGNKSLSKFLDEFLELYLEDLKPSTRKAYHEHAKLVKRTSISSMSIQKITTANIQRMLNELYEHSPLSGKPLSNRSVLDVQRYLSLVFEQAIRCQYLEKDSNPVKGTKVRPWRKNNNEREKEVYSEEEIALLFKALDEENDLDFKTIIALAIAVGGRRGELIGIHYSDFCDETGEITIQRNATLDEYGKTVIVSTKTRSSERKVKLPEYVQELIKLSRKKYRMEKFKYGEGFCDSDCILHNKDGSGWAAHSLTQKWNRFLKKYNLRIIKLHGLRKVSATTMILNGIDPKNASANLGHSDISITMDIYTAVTQRMKDQSADKMQQFFSRVAT